MRMALNYISYALCASIMAPFVFKGSYDVIFVFQMSPVTIGVPALVMKKIKSAPIMFWVQDLWPESLSASGAVRSGFVLKMIDSLVRFIYKGCDKVLVQSRAFCEYIKDQGVPDKKILYFPNSAEEIFKPVKAKPESSCMDIPGGFRVIFAGNIGASQDFDTILAAAEKLKPQKDIQWVIFGDGRRRSWVEEEIGKRGLSDTFHLMGRVPLEEMPGYFSCADVLLATLRQEPIFALTIPSKIQSYLACGKPIVAALEGEGAKVIKESGAGMTVLPEDPEVLADSVLRMYNMPESERESMGLKGRSYYEENFKRSLLLDQLEVWMKELTLRDK